MHDPITYPSATGIPIKFFTKKYLYQNKDFFFLQWVKPSPLSNTIPVSPADFYSALTGAKLLEKSDKTAYTYIVNPLALNVSK